MEMSQALTAFAALSQETRLRIIRLLVEAGPGGMAAGVIAKAMGASASTISFHMKELERAGLVGSRRQARSILYFAHYEGLRALLGFMMEDCCAGDPRICGENGGRGFCN